MLRPLAVLVLSAALAIPAGPVFAASTKSTPATAPAVAPAPAPAPAPAAAAVPAKQPSAAQLAARERMKTCGAEWRDMKAKGTTKGMAYKDFSKTCLARKG